MTNDQPTDGDLAAFQRRTGATVFVDAWGTHHVPYKLRRHVGTMKGPTVAAALAQALKASRGRPGEYRFRAVKLPNYDPPLRAWVGRKVGRKSPPRQVVF